MQGAILQRRGLLGWWADWASHPTGAVLGLLSAGRWKLASTAPLADLGRKLGVAFSCLLVLYLPLIDVRYYFLDDVGRAVEGFYGFTGAGRPLTDLLLRLLTLGGPLTDIAPAPQLLGVLCLSLAAVLLADRLRVESLFCVGVLALAMGGSPYFLENMSFRFDSGFMALAVLCVIAAAWLDASRGPAPFLASAALLFASLCLYQPAINCYPVVILFVMVQTLPRRPAGEVLSMGLRLAIPLALAVIAYQAMWRMLPGWASYLESKGELAPAGSAVWTAVSNLGIYAAAIVGDWKPTRLGVIWTLMALAAAAAVVGSIAASPARSLGRRVGVATLAIALLALVFPAAFLFQLILTTPAWAPRTFVGVTAVVGGLSAILLAVRGGVTMMLARGLVALQALGIVGVAYTYANALRMQEKYDDQVTTAIVNDILEIEPSGNVWTYEISGWTGRSPPVDVAVKKYPMLRRMVVPPIYEGSRWLPSRWKAFGLWIKPAPAGQIDKTALICRGIPRKSNARYELYIVGQTVLIRFKNDRVICL